MRPDFGTSFSPAFLFVDLASYWALAPLVASFFRGHDKKQPVAEAPR
jgi:hypothetical protein